MNEQKGFTLIELMVVVSIIGILAAIAVPQFSQYRLRAFQSEGSALADSVRKNVLEFMDHTGRFPKNNLQSGLPRPELIKGKYVDSIAVEDGIITVLFNDSHKGLKGSFIKLIPQMNEKNPTGPVVWQRKVSEQTRY